MRKALQEYIHLEIGHLDRPMEIAVNPANVREADYMGRVTCWTFSMLELH